MLDHFKFLKAHTNVTPKMTIPSPSVLHYRGGRETARTVNQATRPSTLERS
jgi:hypothetical protein